MKRIVDGYRPPLDALPDEIPSEIVEMIKACWSSKPLKRPSFCNIIGILCGVLLSGSRISGDVQDNFSFLQKVDSISKSLELIEKLQHREISVHSFRNIQFVGSGCDGLVMTASLVLQEDDKEQLYSVALKMIANMHIQLSTKGHADKCLREFTILPTILTLHPNIIRMLGSFICKPTREMFNHIPPDIQECCKDNYGEPRSAQFFILERYETTLRSLIRKKSLTEQQIAKYAYQLSKALLFLFDNRIAHLDIKCDNLMISSGDDLVVVDFGVAGEMNEEGIVDIHSTVGGNTRHLAPEVFQARCQQRNLPCELQNPWELGMVLYEMFNEEESAFKDYGLNIVFALPPIDYSNIPQQYHHLISRLLCMKNARISIKEAVAELERIYNSSL